MPKGNGATDKDEYDQFVEKLMRTQPKRRGRPPALPAKADLVDPKAVPSRPDGCRDLKRSITHIDQIVFTHLARSLEVLTGIAERTALPIGVRQRAAEVVVETGVQILKGPKGIPIVRPGMPSAEAQRIGLQPAPVPPEPEPVEEIPADWGAEPTEPEEDPGPNLPPPPPDLQLDHDDKLKLRGEKHILQLLTDHGPLPRRQLRIASMTDSHTEAGKDVIDLDALIEELLAKGKIKKHTDPASGMTVYHLPRVIPALREGMA